MTPIEKTVVGVVGAGTMGLGIAQLAIAAGHKTTLCETFTPVRERAVSSLHKTFEREVEKGRMTSEAMHRALSLLTVTDKVSALSDAGFVIEAIVESLTAKKALFDELEGIVGPEAILASNTSSLSVASLCGGRKVPARVIGVHFFNPAPLMKLVEIIPALSTAPAVVEQATALVKSWKKTTVLAADTPGFIVNRIARPFYGEALRIAEEGARYADIDASMRSLGFKMGPFELMDLIGNDVNYAVTCSVFEAFYYDGRYRPSILQKRMVENGLLGKKSKRGFYDYSSENTAAKGSDATPGTAHPQIADRVLAMLINEAFEARRLNIATEQDIETAMTLGVNYPKGLIAWGRELGTSAIARTLDELKATFGEERYRASPLLRA